MKLMSRTAVCAALSTAFLLGAAAPGNAQAVPLGSGGGRYVNRQSETNRFAFTAVQLPDGSVTGHVVFHFPATNAMVRMEVTSFMFIGDWLGLAGPVTMAVNTPTPLVGTTGFLVLSDNGAPGTDTFTGFSFAPASFGNLTIQQIIGIIGPPPPSVFFPLIEGNIQIH